MATSIIKDEPMEQDGNSSSSVHDRDEGVEPPICSVFTAEDFGRGIYRNSGNRADKRTFHCLVCDVILSSIETKISHEEGQRHKENLKNYNFEEPIVQIKNDDPIRTPDVEDLATRLKDTTCSAIGLKFIKEFKPESNQERMPPMYKCTLCYTEGSTAAMFNHVVSSEHRAKLGWNPQKENKRAKELIRSHVSDKLYPWPVDKAPWALEMGGDGQCPFDPDESKKFELPSLKSIGPITKKNRHYYADMLKQVTDRVCDFYDSKPGGPNERTLAMRAHANKILKTTVDMKLSADMCTKQEPSV